ncbi:hypothetical protein L1987_65943 [Smallanthus sonchifolius]|uniref:Uncharacterized protein n=1 Tax=Smallanthus sonchifolius TaxID=185202 RepID=A0ACB9BVW6_9ASTR|nr:hypothetical protein L1987_65943 [Smallanthus sonchifolius]
MCSKFFLIRVSVVFFDQPKASLRCVAICTRELKELKMSKKNFMSSISSPSVKNSDEYYSKQVVGAHFTIHLLSPCPTNTPLFVTKKYLIFVQIFLVFNFFLFPHTIHIKLLYSIQFIDKEYTSSLFFTKFITFMGAH